MDAPSGRKKANDTSETISQGGRGQLTNRAPPWKRHTERNRRRRDMTGLLFLSGAGGGPTLTAQRIVAEGSGARKGVVMRARIAKKIAKRSEQGIGSYSQGKIAKAKQLVEREKKRQEKK